ncbi:MAG TPA: helix-turn-helix domain-containing protein [Jatrophihabitantaceae bacterium]
MACDAVEDFADLGGPLLDRLATPALQRWAEARVAPLADYARIDLVPTIVEYLRRRGSAEAAARAQNLHRHTLKYRIARASELLQCDLTDPDAAAEIWLALRLRGLT